MTHNHPGGRSLSEQDLRFAIRSDLLQIRAVTSTHRYWITRPAAGWTPEIADILAANVPAARARIRSSLRMEVAKGLTASWAAEQRLHHLIWTNLAAQGILDYGWEPWTRER